MLLGYCLGGLAVAAEGPPRVTVLDCGATLYQGSRTVAAAEGLALPGATLLDTGARCTLLRIEWPSGSLLDLGPDTRVMLGPLPAAARSAAGAADALPPNTLFYLLQGWAKFSSAAPGQAWATPGLAAQPAQGAVVLSVAAGGLANGPANPPAAEAVFAEAGSLPLADRRQRSVLSVPAGGWLQTVGARAEVHARPAAPWLSEVPRPFRDTLAPRLARLAAQAPPVPITLPDPSYAQLQPWLQVEPALRRDMARRFAYRLTDPAFRRAVQANLAQHPEWQAWLEPHRARTGAPPRRSGSSP